MAKRNRLEIVRLPRRGQRGRAAAAGAERAPVLAVVRAAAPAPVTTPVLAAARARSGPCSQRPVPQSLYLPFRRPCSQWPVPQSLHRR
jgi:hypothetical protein